MSVFRIFLIVIIILLLAVSAMAQGDYLKKGENGIEIMGNYLFPKNDATGHGFQVSFSINGGFDFGFAVANVKGKMDDIFTDANATAYSPFVIIHFSNEDKKIQPLSLALLIGAESVNTTVELPNSYESNYSSSRVFLGGAVYGEISPANRITFQPVGSLTLSKGIHNGGTDIKSVFGVGASLYFKLSSNNSTALRINPMMNFYKGNSSSSINVGLIFPMQGID